MCDKPDLSSLAQKWPSSIVAREQVSSFTGGVISSSYIANMDCQGAGPKGRIRIGRKVAYPVDDLIAWLEKRSCR